MPRIPTTEITINGRKKIVNANDPRAKQPKTPKPKLGRPRKKVD